MKTYKLKFFIVIVGAVFFTSCTNLLYTTLDVLRPAKVAFANDANDLLIINNTVNQPAEYGHKSEFLHESPRNVSIQTDSMSIFCLGALTEDIEGKDFFSSVQLIPNTINTGAEFFRSMKLDEDSVKNLCSKYNVNVILSLDKMKVTDDLTENYLTESGTYLSSIELKFETSWSIHYLNRPEITSVHFKDTVYWESESFNRKKGFDNLPKREDALVDGALNVGHKAVNRFIPYWDKADRYFFNPNIKLMTQGMDSVYVKNWKSAISLWETEYNKTHNTWIKAQAANNIAIAYEIEGDLDNAIDYATKSYYEFREMTIVDYNSYARLYDYIIELTQRKNELVILKQQLGE
jgi:hypothetical protein